MKPKLLLMKLGRVTSIAKKQAVFDQQHTIGRPPQTRMRPEQLMRKDKQNHWWMKNLGSMGIVLEPIQNRFATDSPRI